MGVPQGRGKRGRDSAGGKGRVVQLPDQFLGRILVHGRDRLDLLSSVSCNDKAILSIVCGVGVPQRRGKEAGEGGGDSAGGGLSSAALGSVSLSDPR